jgi:hypothetical protein
VQLTSVRRVRNSSALVTLDIAMRKAGYNPDQPRGEHGRWSETGTAGAKFPFGPGHKEIIARDDLHAAHRAFANMDNEFDDAKIEEALRRITIAEADVDKHRANRAGVYQQQTGQKAPPQPGKKGVSLDVVMQTLDETKPESTRQKLIDAANARREEANRLAQQGQDKRTFEQRMAGTGQVRYSTTQTQDRENRVNRTGLTGAVADTAERIAIASRQLSNLAGNISGVAGNTKDFVRMGQHLNFIKDDIAILRREIKGLPADAARVKVEAGKAVTMLQTKLGRLKARVARRD